MWTGPNRLDDLSGLAWSETKNEDKGVRNGSLDALAISAAVILRSAILNMYRIKYMMYALAYR